jgi:proliferating cell nuclear antigen|tara:strand:- start:1403 stop:2287 length:885 start_codon:yes stop_codon:yes gene_type:complete
LQDLRYKFIFKVKIIYYDKMTKDIQSFKNNIEINPDHIFDMKTVQSVAIKILIEALKEILTDANLIIDETGIKLVAMDSTKSVLIYMKLNSEKFESFYCKEKISVGINMFNLYKLIKTINTSDTLSFFINKNDTNKLGIKLNNNEKNTETIYKLNLLDISQEEINIPPAEFDSELTMPSHDFQKLIRDMVNISDETEIKTSGNNLTLNCQGDFASQTTILGETQNGLQFIHNVADEYLVQGVFSLKYLLLFTKCTNLCNQIQLYIKNDYPLIIQYTIASLGIIKLCLAPKISTD